MSPKRLCFQAKCMQTIDEFVLKRRVFARGCDTGTSEAKGPFSLHLKEDDGTHPRPRSADYLLSWQKLPS